MNWFTEDPFWPCLTFILIALSCLMFWIMTRKGIFAIVGVVAIVATIASLIIEMSIVTEKESLRLAIYDLARKVERNDVNGVISSFSKSATGARANAKREMDRTNFNQVWILKINKLEVNDAPHPMTGEVQVIVLVNVTNSAYGGGRGRVDLNLFFEREGDQWKLADYNYDLVDM